jgi:hypothetical protein
MIAPPTSQAELHLLCVSAIVRDLIAQHSDASSSSSSPPNVNSLRMRYSKKYNLSAIPRLTDVLAAVPEEWKDRLRGWLRAKPVRTASGVAVVAVMCKPHRCPHVAMTGNICVYVLPTADNSVLMELLLGIVLEDLIPTSNTQLSHIRVTRSAVHGRYSLGLKADTTCSRLP